MKNLPTIEVERLAKCLVPFTNRLSIDVPDWGTLPFQRLAEEQVKRQSYLDYLKNWIEDAQDMGDDQHAVESVWAECTGLDNNYLGINIQLLPESHRAIWEKLGRKRSA